MSFYDCKINAKEIKANDFTDCKIECAGNIEADSVEYCNIDCAGTIKVSGEIVSAKDFA